MTNSEISQTQNQKKLESARINNMVPPSSKPATIQPYSDKALTAISNRRKISRVLLDLFAVSVSPLVSKKGWEARRDFDGHFIEDGNGLPKKWSVGAVVKNASKKLRRKNGTVEERPEYENMTLLLPDAFVAWFFDTFDFLGVARDKDGMPVGKPIGGGSGYTGGEVFELFGDGVAADGADHKLGRLQMLWCDPAEAGSADDYASRSVYAKDGAEANYVRQKINVKLTGDGLQALRERGLLVAFLLKIWATFRDPEVTMFDGTCDLFNYGFLPKYFADLYEAGKYTGRSKLHVFGDVLDPTVYIGAYKADRTLMLYDKLQEAKDKGGSDEPALLAALQAAEGSWFRAEMHFARKEHHATQAFDFLVGSLWAEPELEDPDAVFWPRFAAFLKAQVAKKCRFLVMPTDGHPERIGTNRRWQAVLDAIGDTATDFAFKRPELTLEERKANFLSHSLGGVRLFADILTYEGAEALADFLALCTQRAQEVAAEMAADGFDKEEED